MRYFPLRHDRFEYDFGIRALGRDEAILERTGQYDSEIALKRRLLAKDLSNYFQWLPESADACEEAARRLGTMMESWNGIVPSSQPLLAGQGAIALLEAACRVQEDLVLLSPEAADGYRILAGVVCFPSGWSIAEKIGKSMLATHAPVPQYASKLSDPTHRLLKDLKPDRPVWRTNWGIRCSDQLDQSPKYASQKTCEVLGLTPETLGKRCFFRVERQTLSRLPESRMILFTIHTHQCPIEQLNGLERANLLGTIRTCPDEMLRYKGILPIRRLLEDYLQLPLS